MQPPYEDSHLLDRICALRQLQREGKFLVNYFPSTHPSAIPMWPTSEELGLEYGHGPYARLAPWGKFTVDWQHEVLVLTEGTPPEPYLPQAQILPAVAMLYPASGFTRIVLQDEQEKTIELDLVPEDNTLLQRFLPQLNQTLAEAGWMVWKLIWMEDLPEIIRLANDSAVVWATSALWDPEAQQLVATQMASPSQQLLKAIYATLVTNSRKGLSIHNQSTSVAVFGARRRYIQIGGNLHAAHARGHLLALEHLLSGNPAEQPEEFFYVIGLTGEDLTRKFAERLDLAIPWPVQSIWAAPLLRAGQNAGLITWLAQAGPHEAAEAHESLSVSAIPTEYAVGLRVSKDVSGWQAVITEALQAGDITL